MSSSLNQSFTLILPCVLQHYFLFDVVRGWDRRLVPSEVIDSETNFSKRAVSGSLADEVSNGAWDYGEHQSGTLG